MHAYVHLN